MAKTLKIIRKIYDETSENGFIINAAEQPIEVIRECEKNKSLVEHEGNFWAFAKVIIKDVSYVRMIFAVREGSKKVHNIEKVTGLVKNLENVLIFVDETKIVKSDGFIYLDVLKKIN